MSLQKYTAYYTAIFRYVQAFRAFYTFVFGCHSLIKSMSSDDTVTVTREKRDAPERDVGQRREQDGQIGEQVGAGEPPPGQLMDDKGEGVVTAAGPALPHDEPHTDATNTPPSSAAASGQGVRSGSIGGRHSQIL